MNRRRIHLILCSSSVLFILASAATVAVGLLLPLSVSMPKPRDPSVKTSTTQPRQTPPPLENLQRLASLNLRQPLFDPPPPAPQPPPTKTPLAIKLAGTILEAEHSLAILQLPDGKTELKAVGEQCGGATIVRIEQDCVTVSYDGQTVQLTIAAPKQG
jgi:type II secretory pathway component PulC